MIHCRKTSKRLRIYDLFFQLIASLKSKSCARNHMLKAREMSSDLMMKLKKFHSQPKTGKSHCLVLCDSLSKREKINCSKTTFKKISFLLHFNIHVALTFEYQQQFNSRHGTAPLSNFSIKSLHFHALLHRSLDIEIEIFRGQVKVKQRELNKLWKATFSLKSDF